jgi:ATP-dependent Clp protease ATP-binding subunit ClpA
VSLALDPALERILQALAPHGRALFARAAEEALRLHAEEVTVEHLLMSTMADEDCGAHALVLHAFADPETIRAETVALAPGVMVVASGATLPFSPRALAALLGARQSAADDDAPEVEAEHLLRAALGALADAGREALRSAGLALEPSASPADDPAGRAARGPPLFERFSSDAKRALASANKGAAEAALAAIAPAHLVVGCLRAVESLAEVAGLTWQRARLLLAAEGVDPTPLSERSLPAERALVRLLERLPPAAGSVALLGEMLAGGSPELVQLLGRHKITPALVQRGLTAFPDPGA